MKSVEEKFKKGIAGAPQLRKNITEAKQKWIAFQVEHEYIEPTLNDLEDTDYEFVQLLDGQIWARMIVRKRGKNEKQRDNRYTGTPS